MDNCAHDILLGGFQEIMNSKWWIVSHLSILRAVSRQLSAISKQPTGLSFADH